MKFLPYSLAHPFKESIASSKYDILEKVSPYFNIALHCWVKAVFLKAFHLESSKSWVEDRFSYFEPFIS